MCEDNQLHIKVHIYLHTSTGSAAITESPNGYLLSDYTTTCVVLTKSNKKFKIKCT